MHLNNSKKNTVTSFHQIKCSNRNISSLTMERYWPQLVLNKKFAILSEQNCRHTVILLNWPCFIIISSWWKFALEFYSLHWERECGRWRQKFPLRKAEPLESPPVGRKCTFWLVFCFCRKPQYGRVTGAEFSKSTTHTADGISIRFPRVTRIRDDKNWRKTANNLPHLRVS